MEPRAVSGGVCSDPGETRPVATNPLSRPSAGGAVGGGDVGGVLSRRGSVFKLEVDIGCPGRIERGSNLVGGGASRTYISVIAVENLWKKGGKKAPRTFIKGRTLRT